MKQVMWTGLLGSSLGKDFGFPRWRLDLFLGRNPFDPWGELRISCETLGDQPRLL